MMIRALVAAVLLTGCASTQRADESAPPPDFALSLTLVGDEPEDSPLASAWYVVAPDGQLRAALGERLVSSPLPPVVRRLNDAQMQELWTATRESGALEAPVGGVQVAEGTLPRVGAGVFTFANEHARTQIVEGRPERLAPLAAILRRLAWVGE